MTRENAAPDATLDEHDSIEDSITHIRMMFNSLISHTIIAISVTRTRLIRYDVRHVLLLLRSINSGAYLIVHNNRGPIWCVSMAIS
jgi:hypothetical protein